MSGPRPASSIPVAGPADERGAEGNGRVLFVTGRLAEPALRRVLEDMGPPYANDIAVLGITVAALMTTAWIARNLDVPEGIDLVLIPGLCEGDLQVLAERFGVRVERGPKDLREIPRHFGRAAADRAYGAWDIEIVAEINNVPRLTREAVRKTADYFRASGADVIDLGCTPGVPFPWLGDLVRELVAEGSARQRRYVRSGRDPGRCGGWRRARAERERIEHRRRALFRQFRRSRCAWCRISAAHSRPWSQASRSSNAGESGI